MDHGLFYGRMLRLDQIQRLFIYFFGYDILIMQLVIDKADVYVVIVEQLVQLGGLVRPDIQHDRLFGCHDPAVQRRQQRRVQTVSASDGYGDLLLRQAERLGFLPQRQQPLRDGNKIGSLRRQIHLFEPLFPHDQRKVELFLQRPEPMADRRLRKKQKIRRSGDAARRDNGEKGFNFGQIHETNSFPYLYFYCTAGHGGRARRKREE